MADESLSMQPSPSTIKAMVHEAARLVGSAALGSAVLRLQQELEDGPTEDALAYGVEDEWRARTQQTLGELRSQILHLDPDGSDDVNLTAISEAFCAAENGIRLAFDRAARSAISQAQIVAACENHRVSELLSPRPQPSPPTRTQQVRCTTGNALFVAGDYLGAVAERLGLLIGRWLRAPLQWAGNQVAGEVEL
ncbi:hypothetical protein [Cyanobium usitatum]|uniref:hypothetical protein n=1 Tax=Cyanobium usitatum TaxID=2304190 RepID=UPI002AD30129|nr:hypothetical protein [Cyanobium usitatum]